MESICQQSSNTHWTKHTLQCPANSEQYLYTSIQHDQLPHVIQALELIVAQIHKYGLRGLSFSFNGGKDCTVLLHLLRAAIYQCQYHSSDSHSTSHSTSISQSSTDQSNQSSTDQSSQSSTEKNITMNQFRLVYFVTPQQFMEVDQFILDMKEKYQFQLINCEGSFKQALLKLLDDHAFEAILMGQRRIDPDGAKLQPLSPSDPGWGNFIRVNPILDWSYVQVWDFLRRYHLPYCTLYDDGYTSLGNTQDTKPNPHLAQEDGTFKPAYYLTRDDQERAGRLDLYYKKKYQQQQQAEQSTANNS